MTTVDEEIVIRTGQKLTDEAFQAICDQYEDERIECTAEGEVLIMPPTDGETGARNSAIVGQLYSWAGGNANFVIADSSTGFKLPNGARRSPDAAVSSTPRFRARRCPEFVIELLSPSDWPKRTAEKMREWIENGAELGWMINPKTRTVTIFRAGREPEVREGIDRIEGEGIAEGFVLDLRPVWRQLF